MLLAPAAPRLDQCALVDAPGHLPDRSGCAWTGTLLFELLNEMDGLGDDADVIFLLTSNRPELLEPALAPPALARRLLGAAD